MTILSLYPRLEEQECIIMDGIKASLRNKRKFKSQSSKGDEISESDDVEEVYSISDTTSIDESGSKNSDEKN